MAQQAAVVQIDGLKALRKDLNRLATNVQGPLYAAMKAAARTVGEPIAAKTRAALPAGPRTTGRLQGDVRVSATKTGMAIRMGRKKIPYAGWVDFGGPRPDGTRREFVANGRYLFPAARSMAAPTAAAYSKALAEVFDSSGIWTNTTSNGGQVHD